MAMHVDLVQGILDLVDLERRDDGFDFFSCRAPSTCVVLISREVRLGLHRDLGHVQPSSSSSALTLSGMNMFQDLEKASMIVKTKTSRYDAHDLGHELPAVAVEQAGDRPGHAVGPSP